MSLEAPPFVSKTVETNMSFISILLSSWKSWAMKRSKKFFRGLQARTIKNKNFKSQALMKMSSFKCMSVEMGVNR